MDLPKTPKNDAALGLCGRISNGKQNIQVGDRVVVTGTVMRIHESGFLVVEVGVKPQPAVIIHVENVERV